MTTQADARELLLTAIRMHGGSTRKFARSMGPPPRNDRLVRRWMEGAVPIPVSVVEWLESWIAQHADPTPRARTPEPRAQRNPTR